MRLPTSHSPSSTPTEPRQHGRTRKGFTLVELLLSTVLGGIVIGSAVFIFANMAGSFSERDSATAYPWTSSRATVPMAPAYSQLESALNLQMALMDLLQCSQNGVTPANAAVFVLGGLDETGSGTGYTNLFPDAASAPSLSTPIGGAEAELMTSTADLRLHVTANDSTMTAAEAADSYSIYFFTTPSAISAAVHCRRKDNADGTTMYTVRFWKPGDTAPEGNLSYAYALTTAEANSATVRPGATHYWLRKNAAWRINDHVGTQIVLPDPTAVPYEMASGDASRSFSRFVFFLPTRL